MSWVDDGDYFGPDRRREDRLRLVDRRRCDKSFPAPSLGVLLRKLQHWAADAANGRPEAVERYRARLQTVAKLARERGESGVEVWLSALDRALDLALKRKSCATADLCLQHLQRAVAALL